MLPVMLGSMPNLQGACGIVEELIGGENLPQQLFGLQLASELIRAGVSHIHLTSKAMSRISALAHGSSIAAMQRIVNPLVQCALACPSLKPHAMDILRACATTLARCTQEQLAKIGRAHV